MPFPEREFPDLRPGQREYFTLRVGELASGVPLLMPVMAVRGNADGPTVLAVAGVHGDELLGADVVRRTVNQLDPATLRGTVIGVPMANIAAFGTRSRRSLAEMYPGPHDMNRVFPGNGSGVMSERIARVLMDQLVARSDYAIDLHAASVGGSWLSYAVMPSRAECPSDDVHARSTAAARALGFPLLLEGATPAGSFIEAALASGVPAGMVEFGVANFIDRDDLELGLRAMTNLLQFLDMSDGSPTIGEQHHVTRLHRMTALRGGFLEHAVAMGDRVAAGTPLAEIQDLRGDVVQRIVAPVAGLICRRSTMGMVGTGDLIVYVGEVAE